MRVKFKLGLNAKLPTQDNALDAGYDVYAAVQTVIPARGRAKVDTNLSWEPFWEEHELTIVNALNLNMYMDVRDRSGNSLKKGLLKMAGVVDEPYRGNIGVVLYNTSDEDIFIAIGDKVAQIIFTPCFKYVKFEVVEELGETNRGSAGFGSSGMVGERDYSEHPFTN